MRTNSLVTSLFALKGQYMIVVEAFAPQSGPSRDMYEQMFTIAARNVPAL